MTERPLNQSDEIEERIEKRLSLLQDSIELKLTKEIDALLKSRFESTGKILSWAFGLVAIVFAGFGIKTLLDVREVARTTAIAEVKEKLAIDDPNSDFRRNIDKIVARGIIDSYLLSLAQGKQERFRPNLAISEADLRRLQNLIGDPNTSTKDFSDAFEVLLNSAQTGMNESMDRFVQTIGSGTGKDYQWINDQPEKRAALFRLYRGDRLVSIARDILGNEKTDKELLIAAIKYSGSRDIESGGLLERLARHRDENVSNEALLALARIEPKSEILKAAIDKPKSSKRADDWVASVQIAMEIARSSRRNFFYDDPDLTERYRIASAALQEAINHGFFFRLSSKVGDLSTTLLYISSRGNPSRLYTISSDLIQGAASGAVQELLRQSGSDPEQLLRNIRAFCLEEDGQCWGVVRVNLEQSGRIVLQTGIEIDKSNAPAGVTLRPINSEPDSTIKVTWTDADAISKSGPLASISSAEHVNFSIATIRTLGRDE